MVIDCGQHDDDAVATTGAIIDGSNLLYEGLIE